MEDTFIQVDGVNIAVRQTCISAASGHMVFLHDSLGCMAMWRDFPERLAARSGVNMLVHDRQGHGLSAPFKEKRRRKDYLIREARVLIKLLDAYGIESPWLFGHSDGGSIALLSAATHPDRIKGVFAEAGHVFVEKETLQGIGETKHRYAETDMQKRLERYHGDKTAALFSAWADTWTDPDYRDWSIVSFLPQISCPVMVIQGMEDEYASLKQVETIVNRVAGPAASCIIPGVAHFPHKQCAEWLIKSCCFFMERHQHAG